MDPIIFNFPRKIPLTPTYGHWGAPGHDGFKRNPDTGEVERDAAQKLIIEPGKDPIDDLDKCFYRHDCVYQDFADGLATKRDILIADLKLIYEVAHLDSTSKGYPTDPYALAYMDAIRPVFELKLMYDLMRIDNFNDEELNEIWRRCLKDYPNDWLDPLWDAHKAIDLSEDLFDEAAVAPPPGSPIILDLDGDGVETTGIKSGAYFDHDGNGFAEQTGWAAYDDGLLALDRNGDGIINGGAELFGDQTMLQNGQKATNGFQALAGLDSNTDGTIDESDTVFPQLKIWQDIDGDGYSASDELFSLDELGIRSIDTSYTVSGYVDANGNEHRQVGSYIRTDGTTLKATDVWFRTDKTYTIANEWLDVPDEIAALPDLQGYGNVYDLHQAMAREALGGQPADISLKDLVGQFVEAADVAARNSLMEQILFKWTGGEAIDPESRGGLFDARKLAVLETLFGKTYAGTTGENPHHAPVPYLERSYNGIFEMFYAQLMAQTHLKDLYGMITYTWDENLQTIKGDLSGVITAIQNALTIDETAGRTLLGEFSRTVSGLLAEGTLGYTRFRNTIGEQREDLRWIIDSGGKDVVAGTAGDDILYGYEVDNAVTGGGGNDSLYASYDMTGKGILYGDAGADSLTGGEDNDILNGGADDDYLFGAGGNDLLEGENGDDYIDGGPGSDTIAGGAGNDYIQSSLGGSDTYLFNLGDGQDTIYEYDYEDADIDTVKFGPGITQDDILITRKDYDLVVGIKNTADTITILNWYSGGNYPKIESLAFSDGTSMTQSETEGVAVFRGTSYDDNLGSGYNTNDIFDGGLGSDTLYGGEGSDTYLFHLGAGQDTISDYGYDGETDIIIFDKIIAKDTIAFFRDGGDLHITYGDADRIAVFDQDASGIEKMQISEGPFLTDLDINTLIQQITAYAEEKYIVLNGVDDVRKNGELMNIIVNAWHQ